MYKTNFKTAVNLAREYYGDNRLKRKDARPTKLIYFERIAQHHKENIMSYEPKKDSGKDARSISQVVHGKNQYKRDLPTVNVGLLRGHCFT